MEAHRKNLAEVSKFKNRQAARARRIILQEIPEKMLRLTDLMTALQELDGSMNDARGSSETAVVRERELMRVDSNESLSDFQEHKGITDEVRASLVDYQPMRALFKDVKPHLYSFVNDMNVLKIWLQVKVGKKETDVYNMGYSVVNIMLRRITSHSAEIKRYIRAVEQYAWTRGKLINEVLKHDSIQPLDCEPRWEPALRPQRTGAQREACHAHWECLAARNDCAHWLAVTAVRAMLYGYTVIHERLLKNLDRIESARPSVNSFIN